MRQSGVSVPVLTLADHTPGGPVTTGKTSLPSGVSETSSKPALTLHEQEPRDWSMLQLHWREKYLKNDDDREEWLFDKFKDVRPSWASHPHHPKTREWLMKVVLPTKVHSRWTCGRRIQWFFSCCGLMHRWWPAASERAWWVILFVYGTLWMSFCLTTLQRTYGTNGDDPISWDEFIVKLRNTLYATLAWTAVTLLVYEIPRLYNHCCKCRFRPQSADRIADKPLCLLHESVLCCLRTTKSRLKRSRLEKCIRYDRTLDDEAATYSYLYDSDVDDPDMFLYYHHTKSTEEDLLEEDVRIKPLNTTKSSRYNSSLRRDQKQDQQVRLTKPRGGDDDDEDDDDDDDAERQSRAVAYADQHSDRSDTRRSRRSIQYAQ